MKKEPVAGGKTDKEKAEDKQGQLLVVGQGQRAWATRRVSGRDEGGGYLVLSTLVLSFLEDIINFLSLGHTTGLVYFLRIFSFMCLRWI